MTSGRAIVTHALKLIGVVGMGAPLTAENTVDGLNSLNLVLGQWSLMPLTIPVTAREVFPLTANRGGPDDPYTIGVNGDFDTDRPTFISNVGLLDTSTSETFEIPRTVYTNDAYASIVQKQLTSNYFTGIYYSPTYADNLASINLWPVPANDNTSLVLYIPKQLREFVDLNDAYDFPPGAVSALTFECAKWLAPEYGQPWTAQLDSLCNKTMAVYQRGNTVMSDLGLDAALTSQAGVYDILSDSMRNFGGR
jgi:hypothetical protein